MKISQKLLTFFFLTVLTPFAFFSCGGGDDDDDDGDESFADKHYSNDQVDALEDVFGDDFESASATYVTDEDAGGVETSESGETALPWDDFKLTLTSEESEGDDSFVSYSAALPTAISNTDAYRKVFPASGLFKLGAVSNGGVAVERYTDSDTKDEFFSEGKITPDGAKLVLTFTIEGVEAADDDAAARVDGTANSEWTFNLEQESAE